MKNSKKIYYNRGLVKLIILIVGLLILFAYLGLNLRSIVNSPTFIDNWAFIKSTSTTIWTSYLKAPASYIFNKVFLPYIWEPGVKYITNKISTS